MFARKSRARLALGLFYGLLLLISLVVRAHRGSLEPLEPVESTADVLTVDGDRISGPRVRIAYQELTPISGRDVETILLLHGSPGHKEELGRLASVLARDVRVLVPDLPGFGSSTRAVPDYSFAPTLTTSDSSWITSAYGTCTYWVTAWVAASH